MLSAEGLSRDMVEEYVWVDRTLGEDHSDEVEGLQLYATLFYHLCC